MRELIRAIRACKTAAEERSVVAKECALIRTAFKEGDSQYRHRNVAKLLFIHMLGYPTQFGQMECLKLIASSRFPEKRVGYLGLVQLLEESTDILMLVTNTLKNDLLSNNQFVSGLALCALGNAGNFEMCASLQSEIEKLMGHNNPYLKKKACLAALRIVQRVDEAEDRYHGKISTIIHEERNHGVLSACLALVQYLLKEDPENIVEFQQLTSPLVRTLKTILMNTHAGGDHDVTGITDPFLQVQILCVLRLLARGGDGSGDQMNDILAQVATNTEGSKNAGNAILYECVQTIMCCSETGLRVLGINCLGRFLTNRDNNIRYVALS